MAQKLAKAALYPLHHRREAAEHAVRFTIVVGSALAVIMAGRALPF